MNPGHGRLMEGWLAQAVVESGGVWLEEIHEILGASRGDQYHEFIGKYHRAGGG